jgi:hypothetical protein
MEREALAKVGVEREMNTLLWSSESWAAWKHRLPEPSGGHATKTEVSRRICFVKTWFLG